MHANPAYMSQRPTYVRRSDTERLHEVHTTFRAKGHLGLQGKADHCKMIQRADAHQLEVCPALQTAHRKLFLAITLSTDKAPDLNSLRERRKFLVSLKGLDCLQIKIILTPKWPISWRPALHTYKYIPGLVVCNAVRVHSRVCLSVCTCSQSTKLSCVNLQFNFL